VRLRGVLGSLAVGFSPLLTAACSTAGGEATAQSSASAAVMSGGPLAVSVATVEALPVARTPVQVAVSAAGASDALPTLVQGIERYGAKDSARIVVSLSRAVSYELGELPAEAGRGPRLFVDLPGTTWEGPARLPVGGIVSQVRIGEREGGTRLVFDLVRAVRKRVFYLPEPFRLVLDLSSDADIPGRLRRDPREIARVVLDPGHGGADPGAIGATGLLEKDVALDVAHRAAPLIARELGISTLLTRDYDDYVALDERVAKANAFGADLFVSIHCNASPSADSHGVMTFVLDSAPDRVAQQVAARENDGSESAAQHFAHAMREVMDDDTVQTSLRFARLLQRSSLASLAPKYPGVVDGGVRRAGFYVLAGAHMPAVLFEASFISHPAEERRLDSAEYRQRLADALVNAIRAYRAGAEG
jgi:N-acetylmuramoyl-L-alanine amidase